MKVSNFLQLKIYRRTFLIYLSIVIVFFFFIISNRYNNARIVGQQIFSEHMDRAFSRVEDELDGVIGTIDNFLIRLNNSPVLKKDFFLFFGTTPAEYMAARLRSEDMSYESYLGSCDNLVTDCKYLVRYVLYYCEDNVMCMEYSQEGYSRCKMIRPEEGEALCRTGYAYTRDIYQDSAYKGKVSFVIDVAVPIEKAFCKDGDIAIWMEFQGEGKVLGNGLDGDVGFDELAESGRNSTPSPSEKIKAEVSNVVPESVITDAVKKATGCNSVSEVTDYLKKLIVTEKAAQDILSGVAEGNSQVVDVSIWINRNGKWVEATKDTFPEEGVDVVIPYPTGVGRDSFDFVVGHLIVMGCNGQIPGTMEYLKPDKTEEGLKVHVYSASPFVIAWKEKAEQKPDEPQKAAPSEEGKISPKTYDTGVDYVPQNRSQVNPWVVLAAVIAIGGISAGVAVATKKFRRKDQES